MAADLEANKVELAGKVSRRGELKYTPTGLPVLEFTIAVPQERLDRASIGYFHAQLFGQVAEDQGSYIRVGRSLRIIGTLWSREFKDRQGRKIYETRILVSSLQEETK